METYLTASEIEDLLKFYRTELAKKIIRDDYRELIELSIIFLDGYGGRKFKIKPPGAMHQAWSMVRAIYSLKISLLSFQFTISKPIGPYIFIFIIQKIKKLFGLL